MKTHQQEGIENCTHMNAIAMVTMYMILAKAYIRMLTRYFCLETQEGALVS